MNSFRYPVSCPRRLLPGQRLPPYSYVSGKFPHPTRDPRGHSRDTEEPKVSIRSPDEWRECEAFLWGIDLFNSGYYWEAHESWEAVWHAAGRKGTMAQFCKALIKFAAAGVKAREGKPNGVQLHVNRAKQLLETVAARFGPEQQRFMGLSLRMLIQWADKISNNPDALIDTSDDPVVVVMPFVLQVDPE